MLKMIGLVFGGLYLFGGVVGFALMPMGGILLGIFPVNTFHHIFHITVGALGIIAAMTDKARLYCQVAGGVLVLLGILGLVAPTVLATLIAHQPGADMMTDNLLHLVSGIALGYFGFLTRDETAPASA